MLELWDGSAWQLTFMEYLLFARQCWQHFILIILFNYHMSINSMNPQKNPFKMEAIIIIVPIYLRGPENLNMC